MPHTPRSSDNFSTLETVILQRYPPCFQVTTLHPIQITSPYCLRFNGIPRGSSEHFSSHLPPRYLPAFKCIGWFYSIAFHSFRARPKNRIEKPRETFRSINSPQCVTPCVVTTPKRAPLSAWNVTFVKSLTMFALALRGTTCDR